MQTQSSSQPRLGNDTLGEDALKALYEAYESHEPESFRVYCKDLVLKGGGKSTKKNQIISSINRTDSTKQMLKTTQDFILAGMGLGV
jgi:hypothetical protein